MDIFLPKSEPILCFEMPNRCFEAEDLHIHTTIDAEDLLSLKIHHK